MTITKSTESSLIVVQWDKVDDSLPTTFIVTWTSERDHIERSRGLVGLTSYNITGLTIDTVYNITVTATNICGTGPEYRTIVSLTLDTTSTTSSPAVAASINTVTVLSTPPGPSPTITSAVMDPAATTPNSMTNSVRIDPVISATPEDNRM